MSMRERPKSTATHMRVTPEMAAHWLSPEINCRNRRMSALQVQRYVASMEADAWMDTGEPITFAGWVNDKPTLYNGQHRLEAIVLTGVAVWMLVVENVDPASFRAIDTGKPRTYADSLGADGHTNTRTLAAAVKLAMEVESGSVNPTGGSRRGVKLSHQELDEWRRRHPGIADHIALATALRARTSFTKDSATAAAAYYLFGLDSGAASSFFSGLLTKADLPAQDPRLVISSWAEKKGGPFRAGVHVAVLFKGWNCWRQGRSPARIVWNYDQGEAFPLPR